MNPNALPPLKLDGSMGEGGGQVLRTSLSLSALTGRPLHLENIRAGRKKPGLQPQHLTCVQALSKICNARVSGAQLGSTALTFEPGPVTGGHFEFDIQTAGSVNLLLECLLPPLLLATDVPSALSLHGGTDVPFAPPSLFLEHVFCPVLGRMGAEVSVRTLKHGFYPVGGGLVHAKIKPVPALKPLVWEKRGKLKNLSATALSANLPDHIVAREKAVLEKTIPAQGIDVKTTGAPCPGNVVLVRAEHEGGTNGFSALGEVDKRAELVAQEAIDAYHVFEVSGFAVEEHLLDQLVLYAAVANGFSRFFTGPLSSHAVTNLDVLKAWLGSEFTFEKNVLALKGKPLE